MDAIDIILIGLGAYTAVAAIVYLSVGVWWLGAAVSARTGRRRLTGTVRK